MYIKMTYQIRILTTAFFAKLLLNKRLTVEHWIALVLLTVGVTLSQVLLTAMRHLNDLLTTV